MFGDPETLIRLCVDSYVYGGLTIEQFEQNVDDALWGRKLSSATHDLVRRFYHVLAAQIRYVDISDIYEYMEVL